MNENLRNQITALINELSRMSDESIYPQEYATQNFHVSLSGRKADKSSKLPTRLGNQPTQHTTQALRGSSGQSSSRDNGRNSTKTTANETNRPMSRLEVQTNNRIKEIAKPVEKQDENLELSFEEREALISLILTNELQLQSKVKEQEREILSSPTPNDLVRHKMPTNPDTTSLLEMQAEIESIRAAQEREIFSSPTPKADVQREVSQETIMHSFERTTRATNVQHSLNPLSANPLSSKQLFKKKMKTSLTPIPEISEGPEPIRKYGVYSELDENRKHEDFNRNFDKDIKAQEDIRQQRMDSELSGGLIHEIDESILVRSDESDSFNELVIKDFAIRVVQSEPDASVSGLPITEQAILESRKLSNTIESLKDRFQIKVARDKITAPYLRKIQSPTKQKVLNAFETPKTQETRKHIDINRFTESPKNDPKKHLQVNQKNHSTTLKTPVNIMDSHNWGDAALPQPIMFHRQNASSDEDFLNEKDMQFDDVFGPDNVLLPPISNKENNQKFQQDNENVTRRLPETKVTEMQNFENIENFESPQLSDLPSDESGLYKSTSKLLNEIILDGSENIESMENPTFETSESSEISETSDEVAKSSASKQFNKQIESQLPIEQPPNRDVSAETQHQKDIKLLGELLSSGALSSSVMYRNFEEGVLDLLLRQSDSLWDPVVSGIPITYFIPSRNHDRGLLDTSITEGNLDQPLISEPHKKLPKYLESLENEWRLETENDNVECKDSGEINDSNIRNQSLLIHGLPKFTYEPVPQYLYRRKVHNIMDGEAEPEDSDDILEDDEMNFDDLVNNVAEPTYDFTVEPRNHESVASKRNQRNTKQHEIKSGTRDVFTANDYALKSLFGIDDNELSSEIYVPASDIELIYNQVPTIDGRIIRKAVNCPYHLHLMKLIYKKIKKYITQPTQPESSRTYDHLEEIMKRFNIISDGRICSRLPSCPNSRDGTRVSPKNIRKISPVKRDQSPKETNTTQPTDDKLLLQAKETYRLLRRESQQKQERNSSQPLKNIRKSVNFAESPLRYSTSNLRHTSAKKNPNGNSRNVGTSGRSKGPLKTASARNKDYGKTIPRVEKAYNGIDQVNEWTSLNISEVRDLIQQARLAQAKQKRSVTARTNKRSG